MIKVEREKLKPIFSKPIIKKRVNELANDINIKFANKNPIFIGVLNGSFIFLSDLLRRLEIDCEVDFIKVACLNFTNIGTYYFWFFEFSMKYSA